MLTLLLGNLLLLLLLATLLWAVSLRCRDASLADPAWGLGFVIVAVATALQTPHGGARSEWLLALTSLWGLRLSGHLWLRNRQHGEDRRYQAMRNHHGARFWWVSWFTVFALQAVILWWVSFPLQVAISSRWQSLGILDLVPISLWCFGWVWETVSDWQLHRFQADPRNQGTVLDRGLWRYSRHPNYFGDFCVWWGLYGLAVGGGAAWTILSPLTMSFLLLYVSGVRLTEQTITSRRPAYADYQRRTNAFFPGPPRVDRGRLN